MSAGFFKPAPISYRLITITMDTLPSIIHYKN